VSASVRVGIVHPLGVRGIALYCHNLANAVAPHVGACELITSTAFRFDSGGRHYELIPAFRLWDVGARDNRRLTLAERLMRPAELAVRFWRFETSYKRAVLHVLRSRLDVVHFHEFLFPWEVRHVAAAARGGALVVITCHNVEMLAARASDRGASSRAFRRAMAHAYGFASAVILHSEANRAEFETLYPEAAPRVRIVHHGAEAPVEPDEGLRRQARASLGVAEGQALVICFGEVKPYKGIDLLLDAIALLPGAPQRALVVIAGLPTDRAHAEQLDARRRALGEAGRAVRLDFRYLPAADVDRLFRAADLCVLPYRRVYQSGVLSQALAFGVPAVVTDVGGIADTVRRTGAGVVTPAGDAPALARALDDLIASDEARRRLSAAARAAARGSESWEAAGAATAAIYNSLAISETRTTPQL
jgi:glycosyltransferase involved in cell wall biosynthesis